MNDSAQRNVDQPACIFTAVVMSVLGTAMFMIQPIYLGALADEYGWTSVQVGNLAAAELSGSAVAGLLAVFWIRRNDWRKAATGAVSLALIGNLISVFLHTYESLLTVRFFTGLLGHGSIYAISLAAISDTRQADRNFAFGVMGQVTFGFLGLWLFPVMIQQWGVASLFAAFAALAAVCLPLVFWLPRRGAKGVGGGPAIRAFPVWLVFSVLALQIVWYIGIGGVWAFVERLGVDSGLETTEVGRALAVGMVIGLLGAIMASLLADRMGRIIPFTFAMVLQLLALWLFVDMATWWAYALPAILYNIGWNLALPYFLGLLSKTDSTGRFAVLLPTAQAIGVTIGPALAGMLIAAHGVPVILVQGALTAVLAVVLFIPLARMAR